MKQAAPKNTITFSDLIKIAKSKKYTSMEFFGFPGAGKTTVVRKLIKGFPNEFYWKDDFSVLNKYWFFDRTLFLFKKYLFLIKVFSRNKYFFSLKETLAILSLSNRISHSEKSNKIYIFDHGIIQEFMKTYTNNKKREMFLYLIENNFFEIKKRHLLVYVSASKKLSLEREKKRKKLSWKNVEELNTLYQEFDASLLYILRSGVFSYKILKNDL